MCDQHYGVCMTQPGGTGVIGPFPSTITTVEQQTDYDKMRRRLLWTMPSGLYVVGSRAGVRINAMTANWCIQVSFEPKLLGVSVDKSALTHELIADSKVFTLNIIAREDRASIRKFTKPAAVDEATKTLNGFSFHTDVTGAPILDIAVSFLECELRQSVDCGGHTFFIGEIVNCRFQRAEATEVLRMDDTRMNYGG